MARQSRNRSQQGPAELNVGLSQPPKERRRIRAVRVTGLFGVFNHDVQLNLEDRITIVHGPNGVGKTVMLRMLHGLLRQDLDVLYRVPFESFEIQFTSGDSIMVKRSRESRAPSDTASSRFVRLLCSVSANGETHEEELSRLESIDPSRVNLIARAFPNWRYLPDGYWVDVSDGEQLTTSEFVERFSTRMPPSLRQALRTGLKGKYLSTICDQFEVRLVDTNRLETDSQSTDEAALYPAGTYRRSKKSSTADVYARDLKSRMREVLSSYGSVTEQLDRTLVQRLVRKDREIKSVEELRTRFQALDAKRRELVELGVLDRAEFGEGTGSDSSSDITRALADRGDVFSLYVEDMEKKLSVFDELKSKLEVLQGRVNDRFQYKRMVINSEVGFQFLSKSGDHLQATDLSSGEQHEIILLYELLFMVKQGSLVLIDEPEISLHVEWQLKLLDDLREALRVSNIDILMATHSPSIASKAMDVLVPLVGPEVEVQ